MHLKVFIHEDGAEYWSEIPALPGCFAAGRTLTELHQALGEAVGLYLWDEPAELSPAELSVGAAKITVTRPERP